MLTSIITLLVAAAMGTVYGYVQRRFLTHLAQGLTDRMALKLTILEKTAEIQTTRMTEQFNQNNLATVEAFASECGHLGDRFVQNQAQQSEDIAGLAQGMVGAIDRIRMATEEEAKGRRAGFSAISANERDSAVMVCKQLKKMRRLLKQTPGQPGFRARTHKPETPEGRIDDASKVVAKHWNEETVAEGVRQLRIFYEQANEAMPTDADLKQQAEEMLNAPMLGETSI